MRIMHYVFGIPPVRTGGLIKYAIDLAEQQALSNQMVKIIYPGHFNNKREETYIKYGKIKNKVSYYEIINPLPVPMGKGILDTEIFVKEVKNSNFKEFFEKENIDILHVHSMMGLNKEFLETAKNMGVTIFFTSHDYFGICPKVDLLQNDGRQCNDNQWNTCAECCSEAYPYKRMVKEQSKWYKYYKQSKIIEYLKKNKWLFNIVQERKNSTSKTNAKAVLNSKNVDYSRLKNYYIEMFRLIDVFHFNSVTAMEQYRKRIEIKDYKIINISHKGIENNKQFKEYGKIIRIGYLGICSEHKGVFVLMEALKKLYDEGKDNFLLNVYFDERPVDYPFVKYLPHYKYKDILRVMKENDLIVVPSRWSETYGFVVLEALSYGVPVIVSDNVGAKDLLGIDGEFGIITGADKASIKKSIEGIIDDVSVLKEINKNIVEKFKVVNFGEHAKEILNMYNGL